MSGASASTAASTTTACTMVAMGERLPYRMPVAVRAMAPVAAMPRRRGTRRFRREREQLASGSCLVPAMPSATTAERSDSIAPSTAIARAEGNSTRKVCRWRGRSGPSVHGFTGEGEARDAVHAARLRSRCGNASRWSHRPTAVAVGSQKPAPRRRRAAGENQRRRDPPGDAREQDQQEERRQPDANSGSLAVPRASHSGVDPLREVIGRAVGQAQQVLSCGRRSPSRCRR